MRRYPAGVSAIRIRRLLRRRSRRLATAAALTVLLGAVTGHHLAPGTDMPGMDMHGVDAAAVCLAILAVATAGAAAVAAVLPVALPRPLASIAPRAVVRARRPLSVPARAGPRYLQLLVIRR